MIKVIISLLNSLSIVCHQKIPLPYFFYPIRTVTMQGSSQKEIKEGGGGGVIKGYCGFSDHIREFCLRKGGPPLSLFG